MFPPFALPPRRHDRGFTLIELLTVIAIIGILAAILIPVTGRVRRMAQAAKSTSNLRQIALAANQYANETKGNFYPSVFALNSSGNPDFGKPWSNDSGFTRYLSVSRPDWVPDPQSILQSGFPVSPWKDQPGRATIGYNATDMFGSTPAYIAQRRAFKQADIQNPGRLMMFAEAVDYIISYGRRTYWTPALDQGGQPLYQEIAYRNDSKAIIVTYGCNVRLLSRTDAEEKAVWYNSPN